MFSESIINNPNYEILNFSNFNKKDYYIKLYLLLISNKGVSDKKFEYKK